MEDSKNLPNSDGEEYFTNSDGLKICFKHWKPTGEESVNTAVIILHGVCEHLRAYEEMAAVLTRRGLLVCAHDHVGHGRSEGDRVHIDKFDTFVNDTIQHVDIVKKRHPGINCFLIGHSMGGTVAVKTAMAHPTLFSGVVLIAPAIVPDKKTATPFKVAVARLVAGLLPQLAVGKLNTDWICRDPVVVQEYINDPLNYHGGLKARLTVCMLAAMQEILDHASEIAWPFFILHGTEDRLCMLEGSQLLYDKAVSKDKLIKVFPEAFHQVHKEPNGQGAEAVADIADWICKL